MSQTNVTIQSSRTPEPDYEPKVGDYFSKGEQLYVLTQCRSVGAYMVVNIRSGIRWIDPTPVIDANDLQNWGFQPVRNVTVTHD
jgi:hypothetical protein